MKKGLLVLCGALFLVGCSNKTEVKPEVLVKNDIEYVKPKIDDSEFEQALVASANRITKSWQDYYSLLEKRKKLGDEKLKKHIPSGMGLITTIKYSGYTGALIKKLATEGGYEFEYRNMNEKETGITAVDYYKTSIWDIIQLEIAKNPNYGLDVIENEKRIVMFPKF